MPDANFLETFPLYRRLNTRAPTTIDAFPKPPISMSCGICNETRTFRMINEYSFGYPYTNYPSKGETIKATYACSYCSKFQIDFYLKVSDKLDWICKSGQFPPWRVAGDPNIEGMLGPHKALLSKGLICESQSYGVGAFAYYRRIIEEIIDGLLDDITDLLSPDEAIKYEVALVSTKTTRVTAEKIDLVKDLLPAILRPNNMNPLSLLHGVLSDGLHGQTDERCLEMAVEVREILTFLASQLASSKRAATSFNERMRSLR